MKKFAAVTVERTLEGQDNPIGTTIAAKGWNSIDDAKTHAARVVDANKKSVEVDVYELKTSAVVPAPKVDWADA